MNLQGIKTAVRLEFEEINNNSICNLGNKDTDKQTDTQRVRPVSRVYYDLHENKLKRTGMERLVDGTQISNRDE